jgi:predicted anti-sigma-YlaC factor YlaD
MVAMIKSKIGFIFLAGMLVSGCSIRSIAINAIGEMLASDQSVFTNDDDIELIGGALPFSLKLVESLLVEAPENRNLLLTAARGFTLYSYAYVDFPAEQLALEDFRESRRLRERALRLYLRAHGYAMRGLEAEYPGFGALLMADPEQAASRITGEDGDIDFLYWSAASLGLAIASSTGDPALLARLEEVEALLQRALALDGDFDQGALHEFAVIWSSSVPGVRDSQRATEHFERALTLSDGQRAGLYVSYAMAVSVPAQNRQQFLDLMDQALAVDPDLVPNEKLTNLVAQQRAEWLLSRVDELFLE